MRLKKYITERQVRPIEGTKFAAALVKEIQKIVATKERYEKINKLEYDGKISFKQWLEFDALLYVATTNLTEVGVDVWDHIIKMLPKDFFEKVAKKYGYYLASESRFSTKKYFSFRPLYGVLLTRVPTKLYHVSGYWNKYKILKKGIIPKKGKLTSYQYPPSVFLLTRFDLTDIENLWIAKGFEDSGYKAPDPYSYSSAYDDFSPYVVFEIDPNKLNKGTKFFEDPDFEDSVRTFTHIPPKAIKIKWEDEDAVRAYGD